jgi:hypothetical protein
LDGRAAVVCGRAAAEAAGRTGGRADPDEPAAEPDDDVPPEGPGLAEDGEPAEEGGADEPDLDVDAGEDPELDDVLTGGRAGAGRTRVVVSSFEDRPAETSPESPSFTSAASVVIGAAPPPGIC